MKFFDNPPFDEGHCWAYDITDNPMEITIVEVYGTVITFIGNECGASLSRKPAWLKSWRFSNRIEKPGDIEI